jgi:hypothetical protein
MDSSEVAGNRGQMLGVLSLGGTDRIPNAFGLSIYWATKACAPQQQYICVWRPISRLSASVTLSRPTSRLSLFGGPLQCQVNNIGAIGFQTCGIGAHAYDAAAWFSSRPGMAETAAPSEPLVHSRADRIAGQCSATPWSNVGSNIQMAARAGEGHLSRSKISEGHRSH